MKTLVIHPDDRSTDPLKSVYAGLNNLTVITGGISVEEVHQMIVEHDRVIILGHGTPNGLMSIGKFTSNYSSFYVVDERIAKELAKKNIKGKILVSQYLNFTQPEALRRIMQFKNIELRIVFEKNSFRKMRCYCF